jgi:hypothetical protein
MPYETPTPPPLQELRLEVVTTCVGFDDILDITLSKNHQHFDTYIVVTAHNDKATQKVCRKHSVTCVLTDLFKKNGRNFNKGAAINAGFDYFQWYGWRLHLDCDIVLPDNFRRMLFNHTYLEPQNLYGADRINIIGLDNIVKYLKSTFYYPNSPQHKQRLLLGENASDSNFGHRLVCSTRGYLPLGFFQLWNWTCQKPYPYSLGTAAHDDMMFSALWPESCRIHLPTVICYHLCPAMPKVGMNWDGKRKQPRIVLP